LLSKQRQIFIRNIKALYLRAFHDSAEENRADEIGPKLRYMLPRLCGRKKGRWSRRFRYRGVVEPNSTPSQDERTLVKHHSPSQALLRRMELLNSRTSYWYFRTVKPMQSIYTLDARRLIGWLSEGLRRFSFAKQKYIYYIILSNYTNVFQIQVRPSVQYAVLSSYLIRGTRSTYCSACARTDLHSQLSASDNPAR
jgi:hypothetical protein